MSLCAPPGIRFATGYASAAIPGLQLENQPTIVDGRDYSEAYFDSRDGLQVTNAPQPLCQGATVGKCGTFESIIWRFRSDGYEAEGKIKVLEAFEDFELPADADKDMDLDEDDDSDAAYESYIDDQLAALFEDERGLELRADATEKIRQRILDASPTYLALINAELAKVDTLLNAEEPDLAAAFFHAYRSLDGYLEEVIIDSISGALMEPIAELFVERTLASHQRKIARTLGKNLRNAILDRICVDESSTDELKKQVRAFDEITKSRHLIVHRFGEPTREQVEQCRNVARKTADLIEAERTRGQSP